MLLLAVIFLSAGLWAQVDSGPSILAALSPKQGKAVGLPFNHEASTPQKITTGCQGLKYANGEMDISYFFVDATGQKKFIPRGGNTKVAFPGPVIFPGVFRYSTVYFHEFCFPVECLCTTCGYVVGPVITVGKCIT